jgi:hypothetical protein
MATGCGLVPAWGETDASANRYHEHPYRGKHPGARRAGLVLGVGPPVRSSSVSLTAALHPSVGALLADYDPDSPGPDVLCSGRP